MNYCLDYATLPETHLGRVSNARRAAGLPEQHDNAAGLWGWKNQFPQMVFLGGVSHLLCFNVHKLFSKWPSQLKYNLFKYLRYHFAVRKKLILSKYILKNDSESKNGVC